MQIEEGKYYKTRDGRKAGPMRRVSGFDTWPWEDSSGIVNNYHRDDGTVWEDWFQEHDDDIVSPWEEAFKVGDKVRCIEADMDLTEGKIYTIAGVFDYAEESDPYIIDDVGDKRNALCVCFEPVTEGPIRTVTRREIVPGVYGRVEVKRWSAKPNEWVFGLTHSSTGDASFFANMTAEELREASHLLAQFAEALEDA